MMAVKPDTPSQPIVRTPVVNCSNREMFIISGFEHATLVSWYGRRFLVGGKQYTSVWG